MILLEPSAGVKKFFHCIDFELLSIALTAATTVIFNRQYNKSIKVHKSRDNTDYYQVTSNIIYLNVTERSFEDIMVTIIHEVRHWIQDYVFKKKFAGDNYDDSTPELYENSKLEKDAIKFEELYDEVNKIYRQLSNIKLFNGYRRYNKV